jgi:co-chaperonin GroES (HSP10)
MKAINYYIVIKKIKEAAKTVAGLELTEQQNSDVRYLKAEVVSCGHLVVGVFTGDIIKYDKHAGHGIEWGDELYHVITAQDVVLVE